MKKFDHNPYKAETLEKWGKTDAYREYDEKTKEYSRDKWQNVNDGLNTIFMDFALCMKNGFSPNDAEAQHLVKKLQEYITANFYACTKQILAGLGQMYVADDRFRSNIDQNGEGTAAFAGAAIHAYCTNE